MARQHLLEADRCHNDKDEKRAVEERRMRRPCMDFHAEFPVVHNMNPPCCTRASEM
ncbi:hypothetical protein BC831DRAFT_451050, partial [Entophlyctis helioformis]